MLLAEAGLSECARDARCSANFDREILEWILSVAVFGTFVVLWIAVGVVTTSVARVDDLGRRRFVMAVAAVWFVPIVGATVLYRMKKRDSLRCRQP